jgi:hypothetical protein
MSRSQDSKAAAINETAVPHDREHCRGPRPDDRHVHVSCLGEMKDFFLASLQTAQ